MEFPQDGLFVLEAPKDSHICIYDGNDSHNRCQHVVTAMWLFGANPRQASILTLMKDCFLIK